VISRPAKIASLVATIGLAGAVLVSAPAASAAGNSGSATGTFIDFMGSFPGTVPANCPAVLGADDLGLYFLSGNANRPGGTVEGDAYYVDVTTKQALYVGHATIWGDNKGFTATFHGSSLDNPGQTIYFHMVGNPRSLQQLDNMACS
jgi:hypothetical protein